MTSHLASAHADGPVRRPAKRSAADSNRTLSIRSGSLADANLDVPAKNFRPRQKLVIYNTSAGHGDNGDDDDDDDDVFLTTGRSAKLRIPEGVLPIDEWSAQPNNRYVGSRSAWPARDPDRLADSTRIYWPQIVAYLKSREDMFVIEPPAIGGKYFDDVASMRKCLLDWLLDVCLHFRCCHETVYHMVHLVDMTLAKRDVPNKFMQLMGVTCFFVATKIEEYMAPELTELVQLTDHSCTVDQILQMEMTLAEVHNCYFLGPEPVTFVHRFVQAAFPTEMVNSTSVFLDHVHGLRRSGQHGSSSERISRDLVETAFLFYDSLVNKIQFSSWTVSLKAASAVFLALVFTDSSIMSLVRRSSLFATSQSRLPVPVVHRRYTGISDLASSPATDVDSLPAIWTATLAHFTGYSLSAVLDVAVHMLAALKSALRQRGKATGIMKMYLSSSQHCKILSQSEFTKENVDKAHLVMSEWKSGRYSRQSL